VPTFYGLVWGVLIEEMLDLIVVSAIVSDLRNPQTNIFLPHISLLAKPDRKM
jgi:hypothetical protein